eukprot:TRINITY_DN10699_c0_g3_i1.p1 TRINITY_DN10699_c0_g3~~TRINITY_DN10699_c0_g3_i1.p1  ORF type:complete len:546 (+),score=150.10 TRINITY_DN10699_c0_g3_i1:556-2193(+)
MHLHALPRVKAARAQSALPLRTAVAAPAMAGSVRTAEAADLAPPEMPKRLRTSEDPVSESAPPPPGPLVGSPMAGVAGAAMQGPRPQYASTNNAMAKLVSAAAVVEGDTAETRRQARLGTPPPMHVAPPPQQQADMGAQAAVAATLHATGIVFTSELKKLDNRLAELYAIATKDADTRVALLAICKAPAAAATAAVAAARRCVCAGNNARDMQALMQVAVNKVNEVHEILRQSKNRATAFLGRRATAICKLKSCADSLQAASSAARAVTLSESTMVEVRDAMTSAQAAVQACYVRTQRLIAADMLAVDAAAADEEQAATAAVRKVAEAEAVVARAVAAERRVQQWRRVVRTLTVAAADYREVVMAARETGVDGDTSVAAARAKAKSVGKQAKAAVRAGTRTDSNPADAHRLVLAFKAQLPALKTAITSAQRAKNAADRQQAAAEAARAMVLLRQQDASATAATARPATAAPLRPVSNHANEETSNGAQASGAGRVNGPNSRRNNALFLNRDRPAPAMSAGTLEVRAELPAHLRGDFDNAYFRLRL